MRHYWGIVFVLTLALALTIAELASMEPANAQSKPERSLFEPSPESVDFLSRYQQTLAATSGSENIELMGHLGGSTHAVAVNGDHAYIGEGPRLAILNISQPSSPFEVGQKLLLPGMVKDIALRGNYAYVAAGEAGLRIIDVSNPTAPSEVGFADTPWIATSIALAENFAYIADDWTGLRIIDIADPANPVEVGAYDTPGQAFSVAVAGNMAYVTDGEGLRILDVSDPTTPTDVSFQFVWGTAYGVAVAGNYAYVSEGGLSSDGLRVINIANPAEPVVVGSVDTDGYSNNVTVVGNYAYVISYSYGLRIINVANPAEPVVVGSIETPGYTEGLAVAGNFAYVAANFRGLRIINVANLAVPVEVGSYEAPLRLVYDVVVVSNYAYVGGYGDNGYCLLVIDIADPSAPVVVGSVDMEDFSTDIAVSGNFAYVTSYGTGLLVIDITNPVTPVVIGSVTTIQNTRGVTVVGNYAYVTGDGLDDREGLSIIDISNPVFPNVVGFAGTYAAQQVVVAGNYAYVTNSKLGLRIFDISNPATPVEVGFIDTPGRAFGIAVEGNHAYIADDQEGLRIINIANPANPVEVGHYDTPAFAIEVIVAGDYAYVGDHQSGLRIIDISNPVAPVEAEFYDTPGYAGSVELANGNIYIGDYIGGLLILRFNSGNQQTYTISGKVTLQNGTPLQGVVISAPSGTAITNASGDYTINGLPAGVNTISPSLSGYRFTPPSRNVTLPPAVTDADFVAAAANAQNVEYVGHYGSGANGVTVRGKYAYLGEGPKLTILDISTPSSPALVGKTPSLPDDVYDIALAGNYAYVTCGESGLRIINVANPAAPVEVGFIDTPGDAYGIAVSDTFAYVADENGGLRVINVSNPAAPVEVGFTTAWVGHAIGVAVAGSYAYISDFLSGLNVINISNPTAPDRTGSFDTLGGGHDVAVAGNYAYMADGSWLTIVNVANPASPTKAGQLVTPGYSRGVALAGSYAYVAEEGRLRVINVANPAAPTEAGFYDMSEYSPYVDVAGNLAYVAGDGGLEILRFTGDTSTYSISGKVTMQNGIPLQGVTVSAGFGIHAKTNDKGEYTINDLLAGVYDVGATQSGFTFAPINTIVPPSKDNINLVGVSEYDFDTGFRPRPNGYSFGNGEINPPVPGDFTMFDMQRMFGDSAVCQQPGDNGEACITYKPVAKQWRNWAFGKKLGNGYCNGMSISSLIFFEDPKSLPGNSDNAYSLLLPAARREITFYQLLQFASPVKDHTSDQQETSTPHDTLNELQNAFKNGEPIALSIYKEIPLSGRLIGHALLPYALEGVGNGIWRVMVYDNNHPATELNAGTYERYVEINIEENSWSYNMGANTVLIWSGKANDHTLHTSPLALYEVTPTLPFLVPWAIARTSAALNVGHLIAEEAQEVLITDQQGRRLGFQGNSLINEIPGAKTIYTPGGLGNDDGPIFEFPLDNGYTISLVAQNTRGAEAMLTGLAQFGPGYAVTAENILLNPTTETQMTFEDMGSGVTLQSGTTMQPDLSLTFDRLTESVEISIIGADLDKNQVVSMSADPQTQQLVFNSADAKGGTYNLVITLVSTSAERQFKHNNIAMSAGDTHYIDYAQWAGGSGPVVVSIDNGSDGTIDEEIELGRPSGKNVFLPSILKPSVGPSQPPLSFVYPQNGQALNYEGD